MREIVFDTETTGLSPKNGDRLVEIGCIELVNRIETGAYFHCYINPERSMPSEAQAVHGLSDVFLSDKPVFATVAEEFLAFIQDCPMIAHNARFDFGFINHELQQAGHQAIALTRMVDTLEIARARHPGAKHSLDALCNRYGIDRSQRTLHGALIDAQLLAQLYVELKGGRQIGLSLADEAPSLGNDGEDIAAIIDNSSLIRADRVARPARHFAPSAAELARHEAFYNSLEDPLWALIHRDPAA